jgi:hypothetical protein
MNIEELKTKFPTKTFSLHGECIVIPGTEFDPDWEDPLEEKGYKCIMTDLDGKPVTLVHLKHKPEEAKKPVYVPEAKAETSRSNDWTDPEKDLLISLWNKKLPFTDIDRSFHEVYPRRSWASLHCEIRRLCLKGLIEPRWTKHKNKKPLQQATVEAKAPPEIRPGPTHAELCIEVQALRDLLRKHRHAQTGEAVLPWED